MMKELDVVRLKEDYKGIVKETIGTIVCAYNENNFEVEFFDGAGETVDVILTPSDYIEGIEL